MKYSERKISQCILPFRKVRLISNYMASQPGKQVIKYTYGSISQEAKAMRQ